MMDVCLCTDLAGECRPLSHSIRYPGVSFLYVCMYGGTVISDAGALRAPGGAFSADGLAPRFNGHVRCEVKVGGAFAGEAGYH